MEYVSGKSGKKDKDIVFVGGEKETMGQLNTVLNTQLLYGIIQNVQINLY